MEPMGENKQRMPAGDWYIADDEELAVAGIRRAELRRPACSPSAARRG